MTSEIKGQESRENCSFCRVGREGLIKELPVREDESVSCERGISEDEEWFATLSADQLSEGHTIVVSSKHFDDITDDDCMTHEDKIKEFWWGVHCCARKLKDALGAERIYVASLCDGVQHLHVHLVPRYRGDKIGFEFVGDRERLHNEGTLQICPKSVPLKKEWLEKLAEKIQEG